MHPKKIRSMVVSIFPRVSFTPYGTYCAAAINVCCLFFLCFCAAVANYLSTKHPFYNILCIATACETCFHLLLSTCVMNHGLPHMLFHVLGVGVQLRTLLWLLGCLHCQVDQHCMVLSWHTMLALVLTQPPYVCHEDLVSFCCCCLPLHGNKNKML